MTDLFFFLKTAALTLALVMLMQIQVGRRTIESHAMGFVQSSAIVAPLRSVARGGGKLINDTVTKIQSAIQGSNEKKKKKD